MADFGESWYTPELFFYEVMEVFPRPSILVDITDTLERKQDAMKATTSQLDVLPGIMDHIRGLVVVRGYNRGSQYAEAFLRANLLPTR